VHVCTQHRHHQQSLLVAGACAHAVDVAICNARVQYLRLIASDDAQRPYTPTLMLPLWPYGEYAFNQTCTMW
jgi:hypothetical protein